MIAQDYDTMAQRENQQLWDAVIEASEFRQKVYNCPKCGLGSKFKKQ
jgi:hypothetical protein